MIKLTEIAKLILEGRSQNIELDKLIELLKSKKISKEDIENIFIYRGIKNSLSSFLYINPKQFNRESAHTFNIYTLLIDNSYYWRGYPKRSKSIVCSTSLEEADNYGNPYAVLPLNKNANIGVCPTNDIWTSFKSMGSLMLFNLEIIDVYNNIIKTSKNDNKNKLDLKNLSYDTIIKMFDVFDKNKDNIKIYFNYNKFIYEWANTSNLKFIDYVNKHMNPRENKFFRNPYKNLVTIDALQKNPYEVWTDSECILIGMNFKQRILDAL